MRRPAVGVNVSASDLVFLLTGFGVSHPAHGEVNRSRIVASFNRVEKIFSPPHRCRCAVFEAITPVSRQTGVAAGCFRGRLCHAQT